MQIGDKLFGFTVRNVRELDELDARLWELVHDKTGAPLCWLDRSDENRAFAIGFRTIPEDSTGVFHILEHSVLCGSGKYPVKKPFVELLKSSVQTFLNAMTFPDKTVYPVSSRNDADLMNLMDVYLDAVFDPEFCRRPEIFMQEGWHYEFVGDRPVCQGVVLNEMKGAFSSPAQVLNSAVNRLLFPDNCYRHVAGGDPEHITELTYERFIDTYKRFYHPSNSAICLSGSVDISACLKKIGSFLDRFDLRDVGIEIPYQLPRSSVSERVEYEIGANELPEHRTIWSRGKLLGSFEETAKVFAAFVLADYLAGDSDAPLKKAIVKRGLGQDVKVSVRDGMQQTWTSIEVWNTDESRTAEINDSIRSALNELINNGADRDRLSSCFNSFAFRVRDKDSGGWPRSISEVFNMLARMLYGDDPANGLLVEKPLKTARAMLREDGFARLIGELFLDETHSLTVTLVPSCALGSAKLEREEERINALCSDWTDDCRSELEKKTNALHIWQQSPDTAEALASIPMLGLSDLADRPEELIMDVTEKNGITVLRHSTGSKLVTVRALFNVSDLELSELPYLSLLSGLYGTAGTRRRSSGEIQMLVKRHIGKFTVEQLVFPAKDVSKCRVFLSVGAVCLEEEAESAAELICEIMTETDFTDTALLKELIDRSALRTQTSLTANGTFIAMTRVFSRFSSAGAAKEMLSGYELASFFKSLSAKSANELEGILPMLAGMSARIAAGDRLTLSVSDNAPDNVIERLASAFPVKAEKPVEYAQYAPFDEKSSAIDIPAQVGYAAMGTNLHIHGREFSGSWLALAGILNYVYLWQEIRINGGAYGCGFTVTDSGDMGCFTYRDPNPARSLTVMENAADFMRSFLANEPSIAPFILGSVSSLDPLMTSADKIAVSEARYFKGTSYEEVCASYRELISASVPDLIELCGALDELKADGSACVVAGKELTDGCANRLEQTAF